MKPYWFAVLAYVFFFLLTSYLYVFAGVGMEYVNPPSGGTEHHFHWIYALPVLIIGFPLFSLGFLYGYVFPSMYYSDAVVIVTMLANPIIWAWLACKLFNRVFTGKTKADA